MNATIPPAINTRINVMITAAATVPGSKLFVLLAVERMVVVTSRVDSNEGNNRVVD